jgi:RNA polymerase sigma-70 factor (ECF subfamily)
MSNDAEVSSVSDGVLLERMALGDQAALRQLMERWSRPVYSLALHILRDPGLAESVAQDVFLRDCAWGPGFAQGQGSFSAWLLSVTRRRALDMASGRKALGPGAGEAPAKHWLGQLMQAGLQQLDEPERELVVLAYFEGLSREEMAERLAMPMATVKAGLQGGVAKLLSMLGDARAAGSLVASPAQPGQGGQWAEASEAGPG